MLIKDPLLFEMLWRVHIRSDEIFIFCLNTVIHIHCSKLYLGIFIYFNRQSQIEDSKKFYILRWVISAEIFYDVVSSHILHYIYKSNKSNYKTNLHERCDATRPSTRGIENCLLVIQLHTKIADRIPLCSLQAELIVCYWRKTVG